MKILDSKQVKILLNGLNNSRPIPFEEEINKLLSGQGISITFKEWDSTGFKSPPTVLYNQKTSTRNKLKVRKVGDNWLIIKI